MDQNPKLMAAITAAVMQYIEAQDQGLNSASVAVPVTSFAAATSLYGVSGRQQMMEMRRLLSLRMTRR